MSWLGIFLLSSFSSRTNVVAFIPTWIDDMQPLRGIALWHVGWRGGGKGEKRKASAAANSQETPLIHLTKVITSANVCGFSCQEEDSRYFKSCLELAGLADSQKLLLNVMSHWHKHWIRENRMSFGWKEFIFHKCYLSLLLMHSGLPSPGARLLPGGTDCSRPGGNDNAVHWFAGNMSSEIIIGGRKRKSPGLQR